MRRREHKKNNSVKGCRGKDRRLPAYGRHRALFRRAVASTQALPMCWVCDRRHRAPAGSRPIRVTIAGAVSFAQALHCSLSRWVCSYVRFRETVRAHRMTGIERSRDLQIKPGVNWRAPRNDTRTRHQWAFSNNACYAITSRSVADIRPSWPAFRVNAQRWPLTISSNPAACTSEPTFSK